MLYFIVEERVHFKFRWMPCLTEEQTNVRNCENAVQNVNSSCASNFNLGENIPIDSGQVGINIVLNINENYWFSLFCITFNTKNLDRSLTHRSSNVLQKTTKITARRTLASWLFIDNTCSNRQNVCHATMQLLSQFAVLPRLCVFPNNFMLRLELGRVGTTTYLQGYLRNWQTRELSFLSAQTSVGRTQCLRF